MKLIIDIPDEQYEFIKKSDKNTFATVSSKEGMLYAIKNGIPVSNEGDLISRSDLKQTINKIIDEEIGIDEKWAKGLKYSLKVIDQTPTVPVATCINYKVCTSRKQEELLSAIEDCED